MRADWESSAGVAGVGGTVGGEADLEAAASLGSSVRGGVGEFSIETRALLVFKLLKFWMATSDVK
jgi:hypothetical protein